MAGPAICRAQREADGWARSEAVAPRHGKSAHQPWWCAHNEGKKNVANRRNVPCLPKKHGPGGRASQKGEDTGRAKWRAALRGIARSWRSLERVPASRPLYTASPRHRPWRTCAAVCGRQGRQQRRHGGAWRAGRGGDGRRVADDAKTPRQPYSCRGVFMLPQNRSSGAMEAALSASRSRGPFLVIATMCF